MIVKVQRPIVQFASDKIPSILVYDQDRAHRQLMDFKTLPDWLKRALEKAAVGKVYAEATWGEAGWVFHGKAAWQPW